MDIFNDTYFMQLAINEAKMGNDKDEVPVGAVVVFKNKIIGRGHNLTETLNDVTAHAEIMAITASANYLGAKYLIGCSLYVTIEPCVMCAGAIFLSQVDKLVFGALDLKRGYSLFSEKIIHPKTIVVKGILERECAALMSGFFKDKRNK